MNAAALKGRRLVRRPFGLPLALIGGLMAHSAVVAVGPGVRAAFVSQSTRTTGSLTFATLTAAFANGTNDLGAPSGIGGASLVVTVGPLALGASSRVYTSITSTGSVSETVSGTVTGTGTISGVKVAVDACTAAWAAGLCPLGQTQTSLLAATALSSAPTVSYGTLAVGAVRYLRYTFSTTTAVLGSGTATAAGRVTAVTPASHDRTAG